MNPEVNINFVSTVAQNRRSISAVGSTLGAQYATPKAAEVLKDYQKVIAEAKAGENLKLVLNRPPRKFRAHTEDILSTEIVTDLDGTVVVVVNKDRESELRIPVSPDMTHAGVVTDDAVQKALKGEKNIFFNDVPKLVTLMNNLNQNEIARIDAVMNDLKLAKQRIESTIAENVQKAKQYTAETGTSSHTTPLESGSTTVHVNIES